MSPTPKLDKRGRFAKVPILNNKIRIILMKKNIAYLVNGKRLGIERRQFSYSCCIPERRYIKNRRCNVQSRIITLKCMENHINVENPKVAFASDFI